jgi:hypothetical protein
MTNLLWRHISFPSPFLVGILAVVTLAVDYLLHRLNLRCRTLSGHTRERLLIIASLIYSLRKRKYIKPEIPKLLTLHEFGTLIARRR